VLRVTDAGLAVLADADRMLADLDAEFTAGAGELSAALGGADPDHLPTGR
jgi:hypothetical protein